MREERGLLFSVFVEGFYDPIGETLPLIWMLLVVPHIDGKFSSDETFFEKGENMWFLCFGMEFVIYLEWRDTTKVEIGREKGSIFFIWIISCSVIVGEFLGLIQ